MSRTCCRENPYGSRSRAHFTSPYAWRQSFRCGTPFLFFQSGLCALSAQGTPPISVFMKSIFIIGLVLMAVGCGRVLPELPRQVDALGVLGGVVVPDSHPIAKSIVSVGRTGRMNCTGTLISPDQVVSAAHCIDTRHRGSRLFEPGTRVQFRLPDGRLEIRDVIAWKFHPEWLSRKATMDDLAHESGDVILLRFHGQAPEPFRPAQVLPENQKLLVGETVIVAGFGGQTDIPTMVGVPIMRVYPAGYYEVHLDQRSKKGACKGDSGGPAYVEWGGQFYFWGISSRVIEWQDGIDTMCERTSVYADYRKIRREIEF